MKINFDHLPGPEPSSLVGFAQNTLERDAENRTENSLPEAISDPATRYYLFAGSRVVIRKDADPKACFSRKETEAFNIKPDRAILLGQSDEGPRIAVPVGIDVDTLAEPWAVYDLRALLYSLSVNDLDTGAIAQGASLMHWHRMNRFCGKCGTASTSRIGGYRRDCPSCETQIFSAH